MTVREEYYDAEGGAYFNQKNMFIAAAWGFVGIFASVIAFANGDGLSVFNIAFGLGSLAVAGLSFFLSHRFSQKQLSSLVTASYLHSMHPDVQHYPIRPWSE